MLCDGAVTEDIAGVVILPDHVSHNDDKDDEKPDDDISYHDFVSLLRGYWCGADALQAAGSLINPAEAHERNQTNEARSAAQSITTASIEVPTNLESNLILKMIGISVEPLGQASA